MSLDQTRGRSRTILACQYEDGMDQGRGIIALEMAVVQWNRFEEGVVSLISSLFQRQA